MSMLKRILFLSLAFQVCAGFLSPTSVPLRGVASTRSVQLRDARFMPLRASKDDVFDVNPAGEERHHPYYDAPEEKLAEAGKLSVNTPPPDVKADFSRNHPDFDAPVEKQLEAGRIQGKGVAAAKSGDINNKVREPAFFDAPLDKIAEAGNLHVNEPPPDVEPMDGFRRNHPDFDAPLERMIAADNIVPSDFAKTVTPTGDAPSSDGPYSPHKSRDDE